MRPTHYKHLERFTLKTKIAQYLASGGEINTIAPGLSGEKDYRESTQFKEVSKHAKRGAKAYRNWVESNRAGR